ncbi:MAG: FtsB family cell division protein [Akkermansiaceae bacterium]|nr:septum formation initiator family protein [Akkermansiaceae bacterium]
MSCYSGFTMAQRRKQDVELKRDPEFSRERAQPRMFGKVTGFVMAVFVIVLAAAVIVPIAPEYQKLRQIEAEFADAQNEEAEVLKRRRQFELESRALDTNRDYLESRARDIGPFYHPGEQVIKIEE